MKPIFTVDDPLCVKCGTCAETCPVKIIKFEKGKLPEPVIWAKKVCINCGHCVAVCPKGALSLATMPADDCVPIIKELNITPGQASQLLCSRRSIRIYQENPVDRELLKAIIHAARYAPTGHNSQSVNWTVICDRAKISRLKDLVIEWMRKAQAEEAPIAKALGMKGILMGNDAGYDLILRGAPHIVIAHAPKEDRMAPTSCIIALTYLELAAKASGLGTCWAGFLDLAASFYAPVRDAMELPKGHTSHASMMLGYPKFQYHRIPTRNDPEITWK